MKSNGFQETPCVLGGVWARAPHWVLAFLAVLLLSCGPKESVQVERSRPMEGLFERPHQCVQNDPRLLPGLYRVEDPLEWPGTIVPEPALAWLWVEASDAACAPVRVLDARPGLASRERWPATWVELSEAEWAGKRMARTKDSVERGVRGRLDRAAPALVREAEYWTSVSPPHRLLRVAEVSQSAAWLDLVHGGGVEEGELLLWLGAGLQAPLRVVVYASIEDQERLASTLFALAGETSLQQLELSFERAQGEQACLSSGPLQRALDEPVAELMLWFSPGATQLGFAFGYEQPSLFSFSEYLQCIPVFDQSQLEAQLVYLLLAAAQRWTELSWRLPLRADGEASVALWREWALLRQGLLDEAETPILALLDAWWRVDLKALALAFEGLQTMSDTQRLMQVLAVWAQRGAVDAEPLLSALLAEEGLREDVRATASLLEVVLEREDWSTLEAKLQAELDARHAAPWQSVFLAANYVARSSSEDAIAALQWAMHETAARGDLRRSVQLALNLSEQEANQGFFADALRTALQAGEGLERSSQGYEAGQAYLFAASLLMDAGELMEESFDAASRGRLLAESLTAAQFAFEGVNAVVELALVWAYVARALGENFSDPLASAEAVATATVYAEWSGERAFAARLHSGLARAMVSAGAAQADWLARLEMARAMAMAEGDKALVDAIETQRRLLLGSE